MDKLRKLESSVIERFNGYLEAAQHAFIKGEYEVSLEAAFFEIADARITDEDVVVAAYQDLNPIEYQRECSLNQMIARVHGTLSLPRRMWNSDCFRILDQLEENLRDGYWQNLEACFDYKNARIVELGYHVPYVNLDGGFTFVLYALDKSKCALLVGNVCD